MEGTNPSQEWAIIGLGNPGSKYARTRHNIGFWALDLLAREVLLESGSFLTKFNCEYLRRKDSELNVLLVKPQKYMNLSGEAVMPLLNFFKISPSRVIALYDDVDLESGALKVKIGGSSGGHHGIDDLERNLGTRDFYRVRIGIGRNGGLGNDEAPRDVTNWVLSAPKEEEEERLNQTALDGARLALELAKNGLETASKKFSRRAFTR